MTTSVHVVGHLTPGIGLMFLGFWHLFNPSNSMSKTQSPLSLPHELYIIMLETSISMFMEVFFLRVWHQLFHPNVTFLSNNLHNYEHFVILTTFFVYATFAIVLDILKPKARYALTQSLFALAFVQLLLLIHYHSADHVGLEGQYHLLFEITIVVSLLTIVLGINCPTSFILSFIRSTSILYQGFWFAFTGFMLWTPSMVPKGCFLYPEGGRKMVKCDGEEALSRAKSLANIQFSWCLVGVTIIVMSLYLIMNKLYTKRSSTRYCQVKQCLKRTQRMLKRLRSDQNSMPNGGNYILFLFVKGSKLKV
ncbi:hypothetical protein K2173_014381 [Erythroxylum novogranatense]|uniref:Uncharacterized protein n=1 Tax=Erythroxylum novogranatense TaxID=1862640 RepID=A0AAV8S6L8_9ROSI|nr:hypothetical protein K2173_014381 [Erythroxylum novogranatense]